MIAIQRVLPMIAWTLWLDIILMVFFANVMILVNHPVKSVLSLMGCFLGTSILWLMLGADFWRLFLFLSMSVRL